MTNLPALREAVAHIRGRDDGTLGPYQRAALALADAFPALLDEVERLRGQLDAICEDGTEEHNAAVKLRADLAAARAVLDSCADLGITYPHMDTNLIHLMANRAAWQAWQERQCRE